MKLSDYVFSRLAELGVRHVFMVSGGGAMHLNDSLGKEPGLGYVCNHHEQACAMAAEGYARVSGGLGVINVTTGPGAINALNGVFGAWTDSVPMLVVSGQVKRETCLASYSLPGLRQLGDQEVDIVRMVGGITKYAVLVMEPDSIRYHLEKAVHLATSGRPGPVWLDIPVDVQGASIDPDRLAPYDPQENPLPYDRASIREQTREIVRRLAEAERPVVLAGTGVRAAGALDVFQRVIRKLGIPVATAWTHDILPSDHPQLCGRQGSIGERAGNFTVQNADVLLTLGSRLCIRQISYNWKSFARSAFKIQVDADAAELQKPTIRPDLAVHDDCRLFLEELERQLEDSAYERERHAPWLAWCRGLREKYPVVQEKHRRSVEGVNSYHFIEELFARLNDDDVVVCGDATACIVPFQVASLRRGQRLFSNSGSASMGYDLPAAIGAAVARGGKRVICLAGDGSVQMNIQELQTIVHHQLPIKIFTLNNGGYLSIRQTQQNFFGRLAGAGPSSGVSFPDMTRIAAAYGIPASRIEGLPCGEQIERALAESGPVLCDVMLDLAQGFEPRLSSKQLPDGRIVTAPIEDMFPFLDPQELRENMRVPLWEGAAK
ncbi:MAG: acetolactate synthase [Pirellula sp.]|nr:acetolactate synthase [Pirellula sp.]